jgi:hypothetical protein
METQNHPKTIIGIPGQWESRSKIVTSIANNSNGYLFAGMVLLHTQTQESFTLEIYEKDENLRHAFSIAGNDRLSEKELQAIEKHTYCLYLVGEGGTPDRARSFMNAANALLSCGGIAVKVESAGIAHSAVDWGKFTADERLGALLKAFVTYVGSPGQFYSCGMHNLGFPDCVVDASIPAHEAAQLIHTFLGYILVEQPTLQSGETFSVDADSPYYKLVLENCTMFENGDAFHNPYGVWRLIPV